MNINYHIRKWIVQYVKKHKQELGVHSFSYPDYAIVCVKGYDPPRCYWSKNGNYHVRYTIHVTEQWILDNVPKEVLAESVAERMLYAKEPLNSQLSPA